LPLLLSDLERAPGQEASGPGSDTSPSAKQSNIGGKTRAGTETFTRTAQTSADHAKAVPREAPDITPETDPPDAGCSFALGVVSVLRSTQQNLHQVVHRTLRRYAETLPKSGR
jgi:hypothetical protein